MESKVEYKVIEAQTAEELETLLNKWANEGWNADMASLTVVNTRPADEWPRWGYTILMSKYHVWMEELEGAPNE